MQPLTYQQAECIFEKNEDLIGEKINDFIVNDFRIDKVPNTASYCITVIYTPTIGAQMPSFTMELEEFCRTHNYHFRKGDCFDKL